MVVRSFKSPPTRVEFGSYNYRQDSMLGLIPCINRQKVFVFLKIVRIRPKILTLSRRLIFITIGCTHVWIVFGRQRAPDLWRYYIYFHISGNPFVTIDYLFFILNFYYGQWVIEQEVDLHLYTPILMVRVVMTGLRLLTVFDFSFCILRFLKNLF